MKALLIIKINEVIPSPSHPINIDIVFGIKIKKFIDIINK